VKISESELRASIRSQLRKSLVERKGGTKLAAQTAGAIEDMGLDIERKTVSAIQLKAPGEENVSWPSNDLSKGSQYISEEGDLRDFLEKLTTKDVIGVQNSDGKLIEYQFTGWKKWSEMDEVGEGDIDYTLLNHVDSETAHPDSYAFTFEPSEVGAMKSDYEEQAASKASTQSDYEDAVADMWEEAEGMGTDYDPFVAAAWKAVEALRNGAAQGSVVSDATDTGYDSFVDMIDGEIGDDEGILDLFDDAGNLAAEAAAKADEFLDDDGLYEDDGDEEEVLEEEELAESSGLSPLESWLWVQSSPAGKRQINEAPESKSIAKWGAGDPGYDRWASRVRSALEGFPSVGWGGDEPGDVPDFIEDPGKYFYLKDQMGDITALYEQNKKLLEDHHWARESDPAGYADIIADTEPEGVEPAEAAPAAAEEEEESEPTPEEKAREIMAQYDMPPWMQDAAASGATAGLHESSNLSPLEILLWESGGSFLSNKSKITESFLRSEIRNALLEKRQSKKKSIKMGPESPFELPWPPEEGIDSIFNLVSPKSEADKITDKCKKFIAVIPNAMAASGHVKGDDLSDRDRLIAAIEAAKDWVGSTYRGPRSQAEAMYDFPYMKHDKGKNMGGSYFNDLYGDMNGDLGPRIYDEFERCHPDRESAVSSAERMLKQSGYGDTWGYHGRGKAIDAQTTDENSLDCITREAKRILGSTGTDVEVVKNVEPDHIHITISESDLRKKISRAVLGTISERKQEKEEGEAAGETGGPLDQGGGSSGPSKKGPDTTDDINSLHTGGGGVSMNFKAKVQEIMRELEADGLSPKVGSAFRSVEDQLEKFRQGRSQVKVGKHTNVDPDSGDPSSWAADIVDSQDAWSDTQRAFDFFVALGEKANEKGLGWGGDWSPASKTIDGKQYRIGWDPAHIEVKGSDGATNDAVEDNVKSAFPGIRLPS